MLEVDTTIMTLAEVLKTSGHVDRFTDWMCRDLKTGDIFRADHLLEAVLEARLAGDAQARGTATADSEAPADAKTRKKKVKSAAVALDPSVAEEYQHVLAQIDNYQGADLGALMKRFEIKAPETGNDLSDPVEFNLMFDASIGPTGTVKGYLRPETAQGHFINFSRLLDFNNGRVPFASAQIGKSFRNEIAPRQGLLRVREFVMAEIEHYVNPQQKKHARFDEVRDHRLSLLPKDVQSAGKTDLLDITVGEAVAQGIVDNETLGYFIVRIHLFLTRIGIDPARLRFRQHMANEMAHYAADCWDAEIQSSYGWIECVGCADRSAYDLTVHSARTGNKLVVREPLPEPVVEDRLVADIEKKKLGPLFKKEAATVTATIEALDQEQLACVQRELEQKGSSDVKGPDNKSYTLTPELVKIVSRTFRETSASLARQELTNSPRICAERVRFVSRSSLTAQHRALFRHWSHPVRRGQIPPDQVQVQLTRALVLRAPGRRWPAWRLVPAAADLAHQGAHRSPEQSRSFQAARPSDLYVPVAHLADLPAAKLRSWGIACRTDDSGASIVRSKLGPD